MAIKRLTLIERKYDFTDMMALIISIEVSIHQKIKEEFPLKTILLDWHKMTHSA